MWVKRRISKYRFSKIGTYQTALTKTLNILQQKYGTNKVFLTHEKDKEGNNHLFIKANLKKSEVESFKRTYYQITNMFFAGEHNHRISI
ncbi:MULTISPECIES: hypothetical protein [unclassified Candidatus Frackibacter]|uniref:hypothetical protein n=1 Tax=unclassified Candidatus Frackibacter TaxID=2648818 RepID=UPI000886E950|nr:MULTISPECIES: hypothetical protein [unclassified Candidatus Frackibacter]SDC59991.1 hypothetical protein SAMN04515661_11547 [Candidatus Frackibacter sp. WG11]SEM41922.1 hypothetical protein SAMN04488698_103109 [Candidatus Frackibacter sp. WG12]SFL84593.1 hypothetical protein SAMN04488699_11616 [Candidatus Frackibacter sp. WG13]